MNKTIQRPLACRNAHCGAFCSPAEASFCGGNPSRCHNYERRDDLYIDKSIPLEKLKQERERQFRKGKQSLYSEKYFYAVSILDKLIAGGEDK